MSQATARPLEGRDVVVTGDDADHAGRVAAELERAGARVTVFVGDPSNAADRDALVEMVAELGSR